MVALNQFVGLLALLFGRKCKIVMDLISGVSNKFDLTDLRVVKTI